MEREREMVILIITLKKNKMKGFTCYSKKITSRLSIIISKQRNYRDRLRSKLTGLSLESPIAKKEDGKSPSHRQPLPPGSPTSPAALPNTRLSTGDFGALINQNNR